MCTRHNTDIQLNHLYCHYPSRYLTLQLQSHRSGHNSQTLVVFFSVLESGYVFVGKVSPHSSCPISFRLSLSQASPQFISFTSFFLYTPLFWPLLLGLSQSGCLRCSYQSTSVCITTPNLLFGKPHCSHQLPFVQVFDPDSSPGSLPNLPMFMWFTWD